MGERLVTIGVSIKPVWDCCLLLFITFAYSRSKKVKSSIIRNNIQNAGS